MFQRTGDPVLLHFRGHILGMGIQHRIVVSHGHRVVGKDMSVTGYGGGYAAKKFLLALELGVTVDALPFKNSVHPKGKI